MNKDNNVYIPKNIKKELEFFRGFGVKELIITILVAVISILPVILIYKYISQVFAISFFMISGVRIDIWTHFMRECIIELCTPI